MTTRPPAPEGRDVQTTFVDPDGRVLSAMADAEAKAWEALSGYKFWMFGYHAGRWVNYNRLLARPHPNPFRDAVQLGRRMVDASGAFSGELSDD